VPALPAESAAGSSIETLRSSLKEALCKPVRDNLNEWIEFLKGQITQEQENAKEIELFKVSLAKITSAEAKELELFKISSADAKEIELTKIASAEAKELELFKISSAEAKEIELAKIASAKEIELAKIAASVQDKPTIDEIELAERFKKQSWGAIKLPFVCCRC
jgi:hypothetical protein